MDESRDLYDTTVELDDNDDDESDKSEDDE